MQKLLHAIIKTETFLLQELRKCCIFTQSVATLLKPSRAAFFNLELL